MATDASVPKTSIPNISRDGGEPVTCLFECAKLRSGTGWRRQLGQLYIHDVERATEKAFSAFETMLRFVKESGSGNFVPKNDRQVDLIGALNRLLSRVKRDDYSTKPEFVRERFFRTAYKIRYNLAVALKDGKITEYEEVYAIGDLHDALDKPDEQLARDWETVIRPSTNPALQTALGRLGDFGDKVKLLIVGLREDLRDLEQIG